MTPAAVASIALLALGVGMLVDGARHVITYLRHVLAREAARQDVGRAASTSDGPNGVPSGSPDGSPDGSPGERDARLAQRAALGALFVTAGFFFAVFGALLTFAP